MTPKRLKFGAIFDGVQILAGGWLILVASVQAQDSHDDLAKKIANPVSDLISLPFQNNYDCCYGPEDSGRYTLNVQPVIPFSLNDKWNLITRTIVPYVNQAGGDDHLIGFGDTSQSFFFSPKAAANGVTWGAGPIFLWPTGAKGLTAGKYGAGPTLVVLKQDKGMTYGLLASQTWSVGGKSDYEDVSVAFLQPFISKTLPDTTSFTANLEATYDWEHEVWTVPLNLTVGHIYKFGKQPVSLTGSARVYLESPEGGPSWGLRAQVNFLFPK